MVTCRRPDISNKILIVCHDKNRPESRKYPESCKTYIPRGMQYRIYVVTIFISRHITKLRIPLRNAIQYFIK